MKDLKIPNTAKTPEIEFNSESGDFFISGISVPVNSKDFYAPIVEWLNDYIKAPSKNIKLAFKLSYVNTSSLQFFYDLLMLLNSVNGKKTTVNVDWYYSEDDIDMQEMGEDFRDASDINFSFFPTKDE